MPNGQNLVLRRQKSEQKNGKGFHREGSQSTGFVEKRASFQGQFFRNIILTLKMTVEKSIFSKISTFR